MNKKGIIVVIVIIILIVLGYMVWGGKSTSVNNQVGGAVVDTTSPAPTQNVDTSKALDAVTKDTTDTSLLGRVKSASVAAAETGSRVALVNGKAQFSSEGASGSIAVGDIAVEKTIGSTKYVAAPLSVTTAGSTYQYIVLFTDANNSLTDQSYDLVGTGVTVTGVRIDEVSGGLVVTTAFKDASGASHSKIMVVENGEFNPAKDITI